ncbi:sigma factor-like helix-turn-helix DNA-binding protein [Priestia megaterium]|uniref:sigma factor-like helix-turn-helix DNA-binding protein n=1 Tax=Priestia megaterium TaxID=1404 RepID=UPI000BFE1708|nr:sigma factor-like helix-turn-helix DNA-binding protein [Priestia megaterium]PGQ88236.1 hypothetical protein COA18_04735 [Priestia megaterium]
MRYEYIDCPFTDNQMDIIQSVLVEGKTQTEVAKIYGYSVGRVQQLVSKYKNYQRPLTLEEVKEKMAKEEQVPIELLPIELGIRNKLRRYWKYGKDGTLDHLLNAYKEGYDFKDVQGIGMEKEERIKLLIEEILSSNGVKL